MHSHNYGYNSWHSPANGGCPCSSNLRTDIARILYELVFLKKLILDPQARKAYENDLAAAAPAAPAGTTDVNAP